MDHEIHVPWVVVDGAKCAESLHAHWSLFLVGGASECFSAASGGRSLSRITSSFKGPRKILNVLQVVTKILSEANVLRTTFVFFLR